MRMALIGALLLVAAGCAGTPFKFENARKVQIGMTEAEVVSLMGRPYMVSSRSGEQLWVWSHANAFAQAKSVSIVMKEGKVIAVPDIPSSF